MAIEQDISASDGWFAGEDKVLQFEILQADGQTPQDASGFVMLWTLRNGDAIGMVLITKSTGGQGITVTGAYSAVRATNTQRVLVAVPDDDTDPLKVPALYRHALKRLDPGSETVLSFGNVTLLRA